MHNFHGKTAIFGQIIDMKKNFLLPAAAALAVAVMSVLSVSCVRESGYVSVSGYAQGGTYTVTFNMTGKDERIRVPVKKIASDIDSLLTALDNSVSGYNKGSLLSRFNAGDDIVPDDIFMNIYDRAYGFYDETGGVVDAASGPLFDIWGFGFTKDSLPSPDRVAATLAKSGMDRLYRKMPLSGDGTVSGASLVSDGCPDILPQLNYNAIAQGYSCDLIADYLHSLGVKDMLVDIGEIFCEGVNRTGNPWSVGVDSPVDGNDTPGAELQGIMCAGPEPCGVVTSGNYRKFYIKEGKKYAHTIDPRTGYPVSHSLLSATIVAPDATAADALATYCMVLGLEDARTFIESADGIEGYLIYDDGGIMKTWHSSGFRLAGDR